MNTKKKWFCLENGAHLFYMALLEAFYKLTYNPYAAWFAFKLARANDEAIPKWLMSYLDTSSEILLGTMSSSGEDIPLKVSRAFNISKIGKGGVSEAKAFQNFFEYYSATLDCFILYHFGEKGKPEIKTMNDIFSTVAEKHNITESVLNKKYYLYRNVYFIMLSYCETEYKVGYLKYPTMIRYPLLVTGDTYDAACRHESCHTALA
tara:strand:+ start:332 stop:949 length:618 start_codon:yes stop_codon:yes gene_type:complete